jgi:hypothetical protein
MTEPKIFEEASQDDDWIRAMNGELDQIKRVILGSLSLDLKIRM